MKPLQRSYICQIPGQAFGIWQFRCDLHVSNPHAALPLVIVSNMGFEMGWFIPYIIEKLIEQVIKEFCLDPTTLIWIEHYTPTARDLSSTGFSQVTFDWHNEQPTNLQWSAIAPETAQALMSETLLFI